MNWSKFLSRKFLLAVAVMILGILDVAVPGMPQIVTWSIAGPIIAYIFGEAGFDIVRLYQSYKYVNKE